MVKAIRTMLQDLPGVPAEVPAELPLFTPQFWTTLASGVVLAVIATFVIRRLFDRYMRAYLSRWFSGRSVVMGERLVLFFTYLCVMLWIFWEVEPFRSAVYYFFNIFPFNLFLTIIVLIAAFLIITIMRVFFENYLKAGTPDQRTVVRVIEQIAITLVCLFALLTIVSIFGLGGAVTAIIASAGFAGIVVGLAAQGVLGNVFSGISIMFSRPYRIGDALSYHGDFATVEDIKLIHTVLRTWDNRRIIVPNSVIDQEALINYAIRDQTMIAPIFFNVAYESDMDRAYRVMIEEARKHPLCRSDLMEPKVHMIDFKDSGVQLRLIVMASTQGDAFQLSCDLRKAILERFRIEGIEIPYPRMYVIRDGDDEHGQG
jgi:small-conductance mechanosensitive channel